MAKKDKEQEVVETPVADVQKPVADEKLSGDAMEQLQQFGLGVVIAAADAALVYIGDNVNKVDFGRWTPLVATLVGVGVREARNLLHGGKVSDSVTLDAVPPVESK